VLALLRAEPSLVQVPILVLGPDGDDDHELSRLLL
jgi:hypothetical protein